MLGSNSARFAFAMSNETLVNRFGEFIYSPMDEASARAIAQWRYNPPYNVYDCASNAVLEHVQTLLTPHYHYYAVQNEAGDLIGFRCFGEDARVPGGDYSAEALDMGGGLRPDHTGCGFGRGFMESAIQFAKLHFAPVAFRATVASFNLRALRVCEQVGYRPAQVFESTHSGQNFVILLRGGK